MRELFVNIVITTFPISHDAFITVLDVEHFCLENVPQMGQIWLSTVRQHNVDDTVTPFLKIVQPHDPIAGVDHADKVGSEVGGEVADYVAIQVQGGHEEEERGDEEEPIGEKCQQDEDRFHHFGENFSVEEV